MAQFFLEAFQWRGVKRGDAFAFYAGDIRVEGPHPFSSSGGNLGTGRLRTAMYTDRIEQLRGTAGARQVRVRAETALAAFTTPSSGGWHVRQTRELTARDTGSLALYGVSQGLITVRPQPAKSPVSRVASPASTTRAVAAIWASKASIGRPSRRRAATISA